MTKPVREVIEDALAPYRLEGHAGLFVEEILYERWVHSVLDLDSWREPCKPDAKGAIRRQRWRALSAQAVVDIIVTALEQTQETG